MMKYSLVLSVTGAAILCSAPTAAFGGVPSGESGFLLGGTAQNAQDPENPANDVIRIDTSPLGPGYGTVSRRLGVPIALLDNMLEFKSYFQNRSCGGGSPRIQLSIDLNGDGVPDGNAFAYTFPFVPGTCAPDQWRYDDVTDDSPRWDPSQLVAGGFVSDCGNPAVFAILNPLGLCPFKTDSGYMPWPVFKALLSALFPNHRVCSGALVDDSSWLVGAAGTAYYDIISMGRATWEDHEDSVGRGFATGCGRPDHDDSYVDGDKDHDSDHDDADDKFDQDRHQRWGN